jgi:hypothetical protein
MTLLTTTLTPVAALPVAGAGAFDMDSIHTTNKKRNTLGSSKVEGLHGMGAGFLIKGKAKFVMSGPDFDFMKEKFGWLRATLAVTIETATQTW